MPLPQLQPYAGPRVDPVKAYIDRHYDRGRFRHLSRGQVGGLFSSAARHFLSTTGELPRGRRMMIWRDMQTEERTRRRKHASMLSDKFKARMATLPYGHPLKQAERRQAALARRRNRALRENDRLINGVDQAIRRHNLRKKFPNGLPVMSGSIIRHRKPAWW